MTDERQWWPRRCGPRLLLRALAVIVIVVVVIVAVSARLGPPPGAAAVDALLVVSLAVLSVAGVLCVVVRSVTGRTPSGRWLVLGVSLLALGAVTQGTSASGLDGVGAGASVLVLVAGLAVALGAAGEVVRGLEAQRRELRDLRACAEESTSAQARQEERLHEVRNVLAGLHGATSTLREYEDRITPSARRRLEDAVTRELRRLSHLMDPCQVEPVVALDLAETLAPVVVAEREQGAQVSVHLDGVGASGRARDLATVVCALLVNARRHAPGSPVAVRAERGEGVTRVFVEDRGPGIPSELVHAVFDRGGRAGTSAPGAGLGLFTARRLAEDMGGALEVRARVGGGACFVLVLPASQPVAARGPERRCEAGEPTTWPCAARGDRRRVARHRDDRVRLDLLLPADPHDGDGHRHGLLRGRLDLQDVAEQAG